MRCLIIIGVLVLVYCISICAAFAQVTFTNVTREAGLTGQGPNSLAVAWGDYDNDGDLDLYFAHGGWSQVILEADVFYRNNGDGTFTDATDEAGLAGNMGGGWYAGFMDYDNDGYLDLHVDQEPAGVTPFAIYHNEGDGTFTDVTRDADIEFLAGAGPFNGSTFGDYDNDGDLDMYFVGWGTNVYYENNGDGTFTDATDKAGLGDMSLCINCTSGDYDDDGDLDIYLAIGSFGGGANSPLTALYRNNGDGTFTNVAKEAGVSDRKDGHSVAFFDYDNDGDLDIYALAWKTPDRLYRNNGDGTFTDVAEEAGVAGDRSARLTVGDYDNDGYIDIFVTQDTRLYHNNGDGTFTEVAREAGVLIQGYCCGFADYDNDGDLDLYMGRPNVLYRNDGSDNNWLHVKPVGTVSNRDGIGARVMVQAGELSMMREINSGHARSRPEMAAHFGLGVNTRADRIEIRWPSGQVDVFQNVPANQFIVVQEGLGTRMVEPDGKITASWGGVKGDRYSFMLEQNFPNPFNPDTWLPYTLAHDTHVIICVHDAAGHLVRILDLGHKQPGYYTSKDRAAYWDGRNEAGEPVASGVYFYTLQAGSYKATRKLTIMR
jgi:hypothetical protein